MSSTDPATGEISPPDSLSIQTFFGAQKSGSTFVKVPEKLPPGPDGNWYRRSTPLTVRPLPPHPPRRRSLAHPLQTAEIAGDAITAYLAYPTDFGSNDGQNVNTFSPSSEQMNGSGAGAFCLVLNQIKVRQCFG